MYRQCNSDFPCEESQTSLEERLFVSLCSESVIPVHTEYTTRAILHEVGPRCLHWNFWTTLLRG